MCRSKALALAIATLSALSGVSLAPARAEVLITEQEAMRPAATLRPQEASRGIFRAPKIYVKHTGQPLKTIEDALERDKFLTAEGAQEFGIIDKVISKRPAVEEGAKEGAKS